jgi:hypothetical protein
VLQSRAACDRGTVIGLSFVINLEFDEIVEAKE